MRTIGMFKTKTHLPELIKDVEAGEELCITNRGRKVAIIIPINKYYNNKFANMFQEFTELKKRAPLGDVNDILEMKNLGQK